MQWRSDVFKLFVSTLLVNVFVSPSLALDESRLWLPVKYQTLYLDLKESAEAAESLEICTKVLRATLDFDHSTEERPVFRILCRLPNGKTYNEMVDGVTKETLTTPRKIDVPLTPEEIEAQRLAEEKRIAEEQEKKKRESWEACDAALSEKIALMLNVQKKYTGYFPPKTFTEKKTVFNLEFDAEDLNKTPLQYRATCVLRVNDLELIIRSRR